MDPDTTDTRQPRCEGEETIKGATESVYGCQHCSIGTFLQGFENTCQRTNYFKHQ